MSKKTIILKGPKFAEKQFSKSEVVASLFPIPDPIDCSQLLLEFLTHYNLVSRPSKKFPDKMIQRLDSKYDSYFENFHDANIKLVLKKLYPDGYARVYRGLSFRSEDRRASLENLKYFFEHPEELIMRLCLEDLERKTVYCSLNPLKSIYSFTGCRILSKFKGEQHYHPDSFGVLFCYKVPIDAVVSWGQDSESHAMEEFEVYCDPVIAQENIENIFLCTSMAAPYKKVSQAVIDYYSLDRAYSLFGDLTFFHKDTDFSVIDSSYKQVINLTGPEEGVVWYDLLK